MPDDRPQFLSAMPVFPGSLNVAVPGTPLGVAVAPGPGGIGAGLVVLYAGGGPDGALVSVVGLGREIPPGMRFIGAVTVEPQGPVAVFST